VTKIPTPSQTPSNEPSEATIDEIVYYKASQRSVYQYESYNRQLRDDLKYYREKSNDLQKLLDDAKNVSTSHAELLRGKFEMIIQLVVVTFLSGIGGLLMGVFPRSSDVIPIGFIVGATMVLISVIFGIFVKPITIYGYYYIFKKSQLTIAQNSQSLA